MFIFKILLDLKTRKCISILINYTYNNLINYTYNFNRN